MSLLNVAKLSARLADLDPLVAAGRVTRISGIVVEAALPQVAVGTACEISAAGGRTVAAEVVGFSGPHVLLMAFGDVSGIGEGCAVVARSSAGLIPVGDALLGRVVNAAMEPIDGLGPVVLPARAPLSAVPPPAMTRKRISKPMELRVRALDSVLTCGIGQRLGIMAGPGVGKSVLLGMLAQNAEADVIVVGLVGERGREVREFVERD
ncbi:MAG TPA: EscN/YscN/HrcN family type III secretion system ATPase, partial [Polyangia bacterium]